MTGGSGYSTSDKIALGVGIGFGIPATIATIFMCVRGLGGQDFEGVYMSFVSTCWV